MSKPAVRLLTAGDLILDDKGDWGVISQVRLQDVYITFPGGRINGWWPKRLAFYMRRRYQDQVRALWLKERKNAALPGWMRAP